MTFKEGMRKMLFDPICPACEYDNDDLRPGDTTCGACDKPLTKKVSNESQSPTPPQAKLVLTLESLDSIVKHNSKAIFKLDDPNKQYVKATIHCKEALIPIDDEYEYTLTKADEAYRLAYNPQTPGNHTLKIFIWAYSDLGYIDYFETIYDLNVDSEKEFAIYQTNIEAKNSILEKIRNGGDSTKQASTLHQAQIISLRHLNREIQALGSTALFHFPQNKQLKYCWISAKQQVGLGRANKEDPQQADLQDTDIPLAFYDHENKSNQARISGIHFSIQVEDNTYTLHVLSSQGVMINNKRCLPDGLSIINLALHDEIKLINSNLWLKVSQCDADALCLERMHDGTDQMAYVILNRGWDVGTKLFNLAQNTLIINHNHGHFYYNEQSNTPRWITENSRIKSRFGTFEMQQVNP